MSCTLRQSRYGLEVQPTPHIQRRRHNGLPLHSSTVWLCALHAGNVLTHVSYLRCCYVLHCRLLAVGQPLQ